jgi:serine/threonine protein kinase
MSKSSWIGQKIGGRYEIEALLGRGGMSEVYKATDPNLKRVVAVKLIHPHLSGDPEFVRRFETEASAVAQLRHPNIIQVFDFDNEDGSYYMVLEFVPGETLKERLSRLNDQNRLLATKEVVHIGASICDAVNYAHKRGMIHRDIKPANVMLNVYGDAILMDFGITKIVGEQHHTATGAVIGTALYMAPEQIRGEHPDHRVDIYSLGVMLFEMVSGRPPFDADSAMTIMMMHLNDPVPDLRQINPHTPEGLKAVIEKALAKEPQARYGSADEMTRSLREVIEQPKASKPAPLAIETQIDKGESEADLLYQSTVIDTSDQAEAQEEGTSVEPVEAALEGEVTFLEEAEEKSTDTEETYVEQPAAGAGMPERAYVEPPPPSAQVQSPAAVPAEQSAQPAASEPPGGRPAASASSGAGGLGIPRWGLIGGGGIVALVVIGFLFSRLFGFGGATSATETPMLAPASNTPEAVAMATATITPIPATPTNTPTPSKTPTATLTPTDTVPPGKYVRINEITIEGNYYLVYYETFEYTETLPGDHVHFFYDTVSVENAGSPGSGPWYLWGGPRPFDGYALNSRPAAAMQMCALVANPDHSIIPGTGNCIDLPESP